ncbi:MAG: PIG-L family deacetylase [Micropruina sp.]|uniref:PIG-L family deacetylase n=1 Tax=Micropruina sp. TaxID=2737536 RepID=UPI0039E28391
MSTIMFVHAHPDDEGTLTAGAMIRAAEEGHRVVVVFATGGEHGEAPDDLRPGETVAQRRRAEAEQAARIAGVAGLHWLGYRDSGMAGWEQNHHPRAFLQADPEEAAERLAALIASERPDVLVGYDWHGNYGHPDHIRVHQVVRRAAELAGNRPRLFEATMNRDLVRRLYRTALDGGIEDAQGFDPDRPMNDGNPLGTPEAEINLQVDVSAQVARRREVMACHASQVTDIQAWLSLPAEGYAAMFSTEHYVEVGSSDPIRPGWFF